MKISSLKLLQFRNISELKWSPSPGVNFIIGENGQGKTSLLEGVSLLATLRSFRGAKAEDLMQRGSGFSEVAATVDDSSDQILDSSPLPSFSLKLAYSQDSAGKVSRAAFFNGKAYRSSSQFLLKRFGEYQFGFHAICFNPSDHDLVRLEPALRRQFLDRAIAAESPDHLLLSQKYQKVLEQRGAWLKQFGGGGGKVGISRSQLEAFRSYGEALASLGAEIASNRVRYSQRLVPQIQKALSVIAPNQSEVSLEYLSRWLEPDISKAILHSEKSPIKQALDPENSSHFARLPQVSSIDLFKAILSRKIAEAEDLEIRQRTNLVGPHRDDWALMLGRSPLKSGGSQGEVRSALLALKIAEIELFRESTGHRPVLLLDDFSSELDRNRRKFLLEFLANTDLQVFVTTTEDQFTLGRRIVIHNGQIRSDSHE